MGISPGSWQFRAAKRIRVLLICPQCGEQSTECVNKLGALSFYACRGEGCDYRFELKSAPRRNVVTDVGTPAAGLEAAFDAVI